MRKYSLLILTWRAAKTLENTLKSLKSLPDIFDEKCIIHQEYDEDEILVSKKYEFKSIVIGENIGIQNGLKFAAEKSQNQYFLLMENDWCLDCDEEYAKRILLDGFELLQDKKVDIFALSVNHGFSNKYNRYWNINNYKLTRKIYGYLRWKDANGVIAHAPDAYIQKKYKKYKFEKFSENIFVTSSAYKRWSNRANLMSKDFFLEKIISFAEKNPTSRLRGGFPELEHPINSPKRRWWWRKQNIRIGIFSPNLFSHHRLDRCERDDDPRAVPY